RRGNGITHHNAHLHHGAKVETRIVLFGCHVLSVPSLRMCPHTRVRTTFRELHWTVYLVLLCNSKKWDAPPTRFD
ncbi:MAG: hypothetical protein KDE53_13185, partial [Caldilineaceae bacterium]|nr:hypothetical protein [Caldilineaceae bacterium]